MELAVEIYYVRVLLLEYDSIEGEKKKIFIETGNIYFLFYWYIQVSELLE
jgi:hypothetical protein